MKEYSDEDVMQAAPHEYSDDDVMQAPAKPAGGFVWPSDVGQPQTDAEVGFKPQIDRTGTVKRMVEPVLEAFGQGFREGWGPERLGLKDEDIKWLSKIGVFQPEGSSYSNPFYAFSEFLAQAIYNTPEIMLRAGSGIFRGLQAAGFEVGLPRDVVALPEAFFGTPHPLGIPKGYPAVKAKAAPVVIETSHDTRGGPGGPSFTAEVGGIEAYHGSPHDFERFDISKIGTGEGAQSYGHGLYLAEHPEVAKEYKERLSKSTDLIREKNSLAMQLARADPAHEDVPLLQNRIDQINELLKEERGVLYQVRINADPAHFLDWDKPFSEQSPRVQEVLTKIGVAPDSGPSIRYEPFDKDKPDGMIAARARNEALLGTINVNRDAEGGFRVLADHGRKKLNEVVPTLAEAKKLLEEFSADYAATVGKSGGDIVRGLGRDAEATEKLLDAGIPGIKYLDQGSRGHDPELIAALRKSIEKRDAGSHPNNNASDFAALKADKERLAQMENPTSNFVVFDHDLIEITHKNGEPVLNAREVAQGRDLGVVGPERPSINEGTPEEAAGAVTKSASEPEAPPTKPADGTYDWQARFDQFVGKLVQPKDVKRLIRNAASENDNFPAARQGEIPLQHVESIAEAAGVEPGEVNTRGLGRTLRNDAEVRVAMRLMIQATDNVKGLARDVVADASEQNLIKFQESILRRDLAVEQIVGHRAEWGRTGNVFQEFMREVKDGEALDTFLKDKCPL